MSRFLSFALLTCVHALNAVVDFKKEVWPIIEERCVECHKAPYELNGELKKPKSGLRLDGAAYVMHGGDDGPVVVANHPSRSPLYQRVILPDDDDDHMPPIYSGKPISVCCLFACYFRLLRVNGSYTGAGEYLSQEPILQLTAIKCKFMQPIWEESGRNIPGGKSVPTGYRIGVSCAYRHT